MDQRKFMAAFIAVLFFAAAVSLDIVTADAQQIPPAAPPKPSSTPPIEEDDEVINIDTEVVNVLFTAQDKQRRLLTNLKQGDVQILENGQVQPVIAFTRKVDLPLSLTIMIDTSRSQERTLPLEKDAARSFVDSVVRASKDEVAVVSFTGETTLEQGMTGNISRIRRAIDRVRYIPPSGAIGGGVVVGTPPASGRNQAIAASTAVWDALWVTSKDVLGPAPEGTRRAIILLSDGDDTFSRMKMSQAIDEAIKSEAVIYSIGIGDRFYRGVNKKALRRVSESTGGRAYFPQDETQLRSAFRQIQEEMRSQYLLVYEPLNQERDGTYRNIEIRIANPGPANERVRLTHRKGYFAKAPKKGS